MLPVIPIIIVGIAATIFGVGCSSSKKEEQQGPQKSGDAAPYEQPRDAVDCFWNGDRSRAHLEKWNPVTLMHFNASARLCAALDQQRGKQGPADFYRKSIIDFFEQPQVRMSETEFGARQRLGHRAPKLLPGENGMLILIAGLAPSDIPEEKMLAIFDDLQSRDPRGGLPLDLFKACYYYNKAVERSFNRWTQPYGAIDIPLPCIRTPTCSGYASGKVPARMNLEKMKLALVRFASIEGNRGFPEFTPQEKSLRIYLEQESARYEKTLDR